MSRPSITQPNRTVLPAGTGAHCLYGSDRGVEPRGRTVVRYWPALKRPAVAGRPSPYPAPLPIVQHRAGPGSPAIAGGPSPYPAPLPIVQHRPGPERPAADRGPSPYQHRFQSGGCRARALAGEKFLKIFPPPPCDGRQNRTALHPFRGRTAGLAARFEAGRSPGRKFLKKIPPSLIGGARDYEG
jgi:hypothetical protein